MRVKRKEMFRKSFRVDVSKETIARVGGEGGREIVPPTSIVERRGFEVVILLDIRRLRTSIVWVVT